MTQTYDESYHAILEAKYSRIICEISKMHGISIEKAMDIFYTSDLLPLLEDGVADLHCRSDKYLAEEIWRDYQETAESQFSDNYSLLTILQPLNRIKAHLSCQVVLFFSRNTYIAYCQIHSPPQRNRHLNHFCLEDNTEQSESNP